MTMQLRLTDASERFKALGFEPVKMPDYLGETMAKLTDDERARVGGYRVAMSDSGEVSVLLCILPRDLADACVSGDRDTRDAAHELWIASTLRFFELRPLPEGWRVLMQVPEVER